MQAHCPESDIVLKLLTCLQRRGCQQAQQTLVQKLVAEGLVLVTRPACKNTLQRALVVEELQDSFVEDQLQVKILL